MLFTNLVVVVSDLIQGMDNCVFCTVSYYLHGEYVDGYKCRWDELDFDALDSGLQEPELRLVDGDWGSEMLEM
jgi:hypothetical protein